MTRMLVVCDADSYVKWGVSRALDAPDGWDTSVVIVRNAVTPSAEQVEAAVAGRLPTPALIPYRALVRTLVEDPPDIVLFACRGPLIETVGRDVRRRTSPSYVAVCGIPGIWFPPTELGLTLRSSCDVIIVHSLRERDAVLGRLPRGRLDRVGLASLALPGAVQPRRERRRVVFAPQALVPPERDDRERILDALVDAADGHPEVDVVIKVRGRPGEAQTHAERFSFEELLAARDGAPANLVVEGGPLDDHLGDAIGFVTVSSTAVIEAVAAGVPSLILGDFGMSADMITEVFDGSGLEGSLADLRALDFRDADPEWRMRNYLHAPDAGDWIRVAADAAAARPLPDRHRPARWWYAVARRREALGRELSPLAYVAGLVMTAALRTAWRVLVRARASREP